MNATYATNVLLNKYFIIRGCFSFCQRRKGSFRENYLQSIEKNILRSGYLKSSVLIP